MSGVYRVFQMHPFLKFHCLRVHLLQISAVCLLHLQSQWRNANNTAAQYRMTLSDILFNASLYIYLTKICSK
jgi:hypothetical protein